MNDRRGSGVRAVTSAAQQGLWFLERLAAQTPAHTVCRAYRVDGPLDEDALCAAWRTLVDRHEALRTRIVERDGVPWQAIDAGSDAPALVDLTTVAEPERTAAARRLRTGLAGAVVDHADGPLCRLALVRLGPEEHELLLVLHRLVADDSSARILVTELGECYSAAVQGREPALPFLPLQYRDFARWQREQATGPTYRRLAQWWRGALTPPPPALSLPADRPPAADSGYAGAAVDFDWGEETAGRLREVCAAEGTVPAVVLSAAFHALLFRHTGEQRVAVGHPVVVRPRPEFAGTVGPFQNPLVVCADFADSPTFRHLLARVAQARRAALDHGELPFADVVAEVEVDRDAQRLPLLDAAFTCPESPEPDPALAGATVRRLPVRAGAVPVGLSLEVDTVEPAVTGTLAYRTELFEADSVRALLGQLRTLLDAALKDPGQPVAVLPLETPEQLRAAARAADRVEPVATGWSTVAAAVHGRAEQHPGDTAVAGQSEGVSYGELATLASSTARGLQRLGLAAGAPVAVRMPTGPRQVAVLLGVLDAGAHLVCIGAGEAGERGRLILGDLRPAYLLVEGDPEDDELARWYRTELDGRAVAVGALHRAAGEDAAPVPAGPDGPDLAYVAYTSGSTGRPKGIPHTHAGFAQFCEWMATHFEMGPGSRVAQWAAPGYDAALCEIFAALGSGATLHPVPDRVRVDPRRLVRWLADERITHFQTVPSFAREVLRALVSRNRGDALPALRHLLLAGEPLPGELAGELRRALPAARLTNLYGPTEIVLATWHEVTGPVRGTVPVGVPIPGRQVLVVDDQDRPCPAGVTGELVVRSPYVTPGYVGAETPGDAFTPLRAHEELGLPDRGWYRTGDLGRRRLDGLLEFRGRQDFQIKFFGTRLELTDVETALAAADSVAECAVVPVRDHSGLVVRLMAYVVAREPADGAGGSDLTAAWRARLRQRFGSLMPPVSFRNLPTLPRNVGGKVDRRRLPAPTSLRAPGDRQPTTPTERLLAAVWAEVLGTDEVAPEDSLFALGGHSLLIPPLLHHVRERTGVTVPARRFLADPTLAGLAALVDAATRTDDGARAQREVSGTA
ncbi:AMP-binding protein [Micromonospora chaiyaphumensis]|uniref:Amino acid adenylation domain-containing protein n=1 Tax=Micromonospora chaiyaphumensis TaxID=307119 RepID=A0A1C4W0J6_9ACTN|nr:AMP-binding protein [Micromonospora chaiyaphumensis]SCE89635.1 amino acid adenylation domain-containing protein [Micromonospora chaiyaphumensis]